ncbi:uncharacterized protein ACWYII_022829 [Salvelinus alpinus]
MATILDAWQGLKIPVSHNFKDKSYSGLWETMLTKDPYRHDYKNILELVQLMLVLPISAAQCERGFSVQNRIKNSSRRPDGDQPGGAFCRGVGSHSCRGPLADLKACQTANMQQQLDN